MKIIAKRLLPGLVGPLALAACTLAGCDRGATTNETPPPPAATSETSSPPPATGAVRPDLLGTAWLLQELGGSAVLPDVQTTLSFQRAGRIAGRSGCNGYTGTATITGDRIAIGPLASTKVMCPPPVMEQESRFVDALGKAERLEVVGGRVLHLHSAGLEQPLKFIPLSEAPGGVH